MPAPTDGKDDGGGGCSLVGRRGGGVLVAVLEFLDFLFHGCNGALEVVDGGFELIGAGFVLLGFDVDCNDFGLHGGCSFRDCLEGAFIGFLCVLFHNSFDEVGDGVRRGGIFDAGSDLVGSLANIRRDINFIIVIFITGFLFVGGGAACRCAGALR